MIENLAEAAVLLFRVDTFLMVSAGVILGMLVGALPGFSTVMAIAILLPVSFFLEPVVGIPFLLGIAKGSMFGGSIPAILVGIPGTGAAIATVLDGYPMTRKGESQKALDMALASSVIGDLAGSMVTILLIGPISILALMLGPPELFAVLLLSLLAIVLTSEGHVVKALVMLLVGGFLALIGQDPIAGLPRFTFGMPILEAGLDILPLVIGLFAVPEILLAAEKRIGATIESVRSRPQGPRMTFTELRGGMRVIWRSTVIGVLIGLMPGAGGIVAAFMGYADAKNSSPHPETFGKGEIEGVASAEAANNAVNGPTNVPLLTLGIPGDTITAILLGAFVAQGLRPGPQMFEQQAPLIYAILLSMILACALLYIYGYLLLPIISRIVVIPRHYLLPLIVVFAVAGTYVYRSNPLDLYTMMVLGMIGYVLKKFAFDMTPLIMAFILLPSIEYSLGQTVTLGGDALGSYLVFDRPIAFTMLALAPVLTFYMLRRKRKYG